MGPKKLYPIPPHAHSAHFYPLWGLLSWPTWAFHVGLMLSDPYGNHITCLLLSHAHLADSYPLWHPYGLTIWASYIGPMLLKPCGAQTICPVLAHTHLVPMLPLYNPYGAHMYMLAGLSFDWIV